MKKLLCIILSAIMFTSVFYGMDIIVNAAEVVAIDEDYTEEDEYLTDGNYAYQLIETENSDGTYTISAELVSYLGSSSSVTVPTTLGGYNVTSIGSDAFAYNSKVEKITISKNVTNITASAFQGCYSLTAFAVSSNPNYVVSSGVLLNSNYTELIAFPPGKSSSYTTASTVKYIRDNAFYGNEDLTSITLSGNIVSIGSNAFYGCVGLKTVTLPSKLTTLGAGAFSYCESLTSITIPDSVTELGDGAFEGCVGVTSITWGKGLDSTGPRTFAYCESLKNAIVSNLPSHITKIGDGTFEGCTGLTSVAIPNHITEIGEGAFSGCSGVTSISWGTGFSYTGPRAFSMCEGLKTVTIPSHITEISDGTFEGCSALSSVTISSSVDTIGLGAFAYCTGLKSITIPSNVSYIGDYAFEGCASLTGITLNEGVETISPGAFSYCESLTTITIPASVTTMDSTVFSSCNSLKTISVNSKNPNYTAVSNVLFSKNTTINEDNTKVHTATLMCYPLGKASKTYDEDDIPNESYTVPDTISSLYISEKGEETVTYKVDTLASSSFVNNGLLVKITIGNNVKVIESNVFSGCVNLSTITIPDSVERIGMDTFTDTLWLMNKKEGLLYISNILYTYIGDTPPSTISVASGTERIEEGALAYGYDITKVTIPNSVKSIGNDAFGCCEKLSTISFGSGLTEIGATAFFNCTSLKSISLPSNLQIIGDQAFDGCTGFTTVTLPAGVNDLGDGVFQNCFNLTKINVDANNNTYCSVDGVVFDKDIKTLVQYPIANTATSYTVPNGTVELKALAFVGALYLTDITIPASVKNIGLDSFMDFVDDKSVITIHGYVETYAETYAKENSITFVEMELTGGFVNETDGLKYLYVNEKYAQGWLEVNSNKYYFGVDGYALKGWQLVSTVGYNFSDDGVMKEKCGDLGDANCDGYVNISDVTYMQKIIALIESDNDKIKLLADVMGDNNINIRDVTRLQLYLARKVSSFPAADNNPNK